MNTARRLLVGALFAGGLVTMSALADGTFYSYYDGKKYEFKITAERQAVCPKWDVEKDANPPCSAGKALLKAREFIATIETGDTLPWDTKAGPWDGKDADLGKGKDGLFWEFEDLALVNVNGWVWRARYRLAKHGVMTGIWPKMDCWILMDGTVIQPRVTKDKT